MLAERAKYYYFERQKNCAEGLILAANDVYKLGITENEAALFNGFGGGMGCGGTCGALSGALGVLSRLYGSRPKEEFRPICAEYVAEFERELGSLECSVLKEKYHNDEERCIKTVSLAAEVLEKYIDKIEGNNGNSEESGCTLSSEDIKRVKGLGFLRHKPEPLHR